MGKIFCLLGKSSSGKDTLGRSLLNDKELQLKPIVLYTTRPIRVHEVNGCEYHFTDAAAIDEFEKQGRIIERRDYKTVKGIWTYCTVDDGQIDLGNGDYLMITTLEGYRQLKNYFGAKAVVPLYIEVDDGVRLERAMRREKRQKRPNYAELCRRFLADSRDFSPKRLKGQGIYKKYENHNLKSCLANLTEEIKKQCHGYKSKSKISR